MDDRKRSFLAQRLATEKDIWKVDTPCFESNEDFYTVNTDKQSELISQYCSACSWSIQCLQLALVNEEIYGIWGGTNEISRRQMISKIKANELTIEQAILEAALEIKPENNGVTTQ